MKDLTGCCPFPVEEALASASAFFLAFFSSSAASEGAAAAGAAFMSGGAVMATAKLFFLPDYSFFSSFFGSGQPLLRSSAIFAQEKRTASCNKSLQPYNSENVSLFV